MTTVGGVLAGWQWGWGKDSTQHGDCLLSGGITSVGWTWECTRTLSPCQGSNQECARTHCHEASHWPARERRHAGYKRAHTLTDNISAVIRSVVNMNIFFFQCNCTICVRLFQEHWDAFPSLFGSAGTEWSGLQCWRVRKAKTCDASQTRSAGISGLQPGWTQLLPHQHRRHSTGLNPLLLQPAMFFFYLKCLEGGVHMQGQQCTVRHKIFKLVHVLTCMLYCRFCS